MGDYTALRREIEAAMRDAEKSHRDPLKAKIFVSVSRLLGLLEHFDDLQDAQGFDEQDNQ